MTPTDSPWIRAVSLAPPTLQDNTADADRLIAALKAEFQTDAVQIDLDLLKRLPQQLREYEYHLRCILFKDRQCWQLIAVTSIQDPDPVAGLAVDLGTSRVVLRLLDLATGEIIAIGMLPDLPVETYQCLVNSCLGGATLALTRLDCFEEVDRIRNRITYLELNVNPEFMNRFSAAKFLPHTNPELFPSVKILNRN